jgi:uncharacterized protein YndB with AHSA1/START domain
MSQVADSIWIRASTEAVYDFAWRPERATEWIAGMIGIADVRPGNSETGLGYRFAWTYRMAGLTFHGINEVIEAERPRRMVEQATGDLDSTWTWIFTPEAGGTRVRLTVTYTPPFGVPGRLLDPVVLRSLNRRALQRTLANLKQILESCQEPA